MCIMKTMDRFSGYLLRAFCAAGNFISQRVLGHTPEHLAELREVGMDIENQERRKTAQNFPKQKL